MREKELRLALVCYGGISLAVYMHGITKEIWRLARASRAFHDGDPAASGTQGVYRALLEEIADAGDIKLRVLVDIIAGASAGGINGIFLAQAIATGQSLEPLTRLWLEVADVEALIDPKQGPGSRFTKLWAVPIAWMMAGKRAAQVEEQVEADARDEVLRKLEHFVRSRWFEPPFGGARFTHLMLDALEAMAAGPASPRLLPPGQPLDLFVTVTDFRGHPERLRLNSPPEVVETEHRLTVPFTDHGEPGESLADLAELSFAARATSSFPGAFPPFGVGELDAVLAERGRRWPGRHEFLRRVLPRLAAVGAAERAVLIDGSVLANAPFKPAIDALRERPARRQIDRRFVYIDPYPGMKFEFAGTAGAQPTFFQTLVGALSEIPRQQPIRDNLEAIAERSRRIERTRSVIENIAPEVESQIEALFGYTLWLDYPTPARLAAWRGRAQGAAAAKAGYTYAAYGQLKVQGVVELVTELIYSAGGEAGPGRRDRVRRQVGAAAAAMGLNDDSFSRGASPAAIAFLRRFDLGFRIRRLRFLARRLTRLEAEQPEAALTALREAIYASLSAYLECKRSERYEHLRAASRSLRDDAGPVMEKLAEAMDLIGLDTATDARLAEAFGGLAREVKRPILLDYLGFPYFDVATLPLLQGEGLDEFDPIRVDRIAPDDATSIRAGGAQATLKGIQFNTFGAFFSRAYRENDYLWGRLHGAERMIDIVLSTLPATVRLKPGRVAAIKRRAFLAILDEEKDRLGAVQGLIRSLYIEVGG